jgi:16S rRNA (cytidine1402-2'-O)-methyltransferase
MGKLFIVGTPIGNLEDITFRAVRVLKEVDLILCEDTRVTSRLLQKYEIPKKPLLTYNEQDSGVAIEKIIELLAEGKSVALVTDAGTPGISDPGSYLVSKIRESLPDLKIESVPGPSALTTAFSIAGIPVSDFTFLGFLPHKKGRETLFKEISSMERTAVFYESPHRILKTLESLQKFAPAKKVTIARELTKMFEEVVSGLPSELLEFFGKNSEKIKGEFVVIVSTLQK